MVRLAIQGDRRFAASGLEIRRGGRSYTVDTLRAIRRLCRPTASLFFIMGADQMREIESWRDPERILMMAQIVIMTRPGVSLRGLPPRWRRPVRLIRVTPIGLSSTAIRMRINAGKSIRSFVPEKVREYIERHRLYARP
jgi:nicotinate-nucleotide adenylyltransferase